MKTMKSIHSRTNPLIAHVSSLAHKKGRAQHRQFGAEGIRACTTLIKSGIKPLHLFITNELVQEAQDLVDADRIVIVPDHVMAKISTTKTPSGFLGQFEIPAEPSPDQLSAGIVLAGIANPGNMGTLIRTAAALECTSIVIIGGADPWSPKVVQASAGTLGMVLIFPWKWEQLLRHKKDYALYALTAQGGKNPTALSLRNNFLVVGSEAHGIPSLWQAECDARITLPMPGGTESLNAAIAGSIALYLAYQNAE